MAARSFTRYANLRRRIAQGQAQVHFTMLAASAPRPAVVAPQAEPAARLHVTAHCINAAGIQVGTQVNTVMPMAAGLRIEERSAGADGLRMVYQFNTGA